ncbi:MAG: B12-binding domain-containing radical SAM protein [bacterium]
MRITFINPKPAIWIKSATIPLGIAYISSYLRAKGFDEIDAVDLNFDPAAQIPISDIYGITATTPLINPAFETAARIKAAAPDTKIILGGAHPTNEPEEALNNRNIDFVIRGEGEKVFYELISALAQKKDFSGISGLSYMRDNMPVHNPSEFIEDLDALPFPDIEIFGDLSKYTHPQPLIGWRKPVVNMITSRGCPFDCYFCYKGTFGRKWRARSPENVIREWEKLIRVNRVKEIGIQDDIFNTDLNRAKNIMKGITADKLKIPFTFPNGIRADILDEELVSMMKDAGLYRTAIGVESGVQEVVDKIGKNEKLADVEKAMKLVEKYKIQVITFYVMGHPDDTEKTMEETIKYSIKLDPHFSQYAMATPFPGTRLYDKLKKTGGLKIKKWDDYSQFDQKGYFDYPHLSGDTIMKYVKRAYKKFYFRAGFIVKMLTLKDFYIKIPQFLQGLVHFVIKGK